jgi:hypothetical protein
MRYSAHSLAIDPSAFRPLLGCRFFPKTRDFLQVVDFFGGALWRPDGLAGSDQSAGEIALMANAPTHLKTNHG